MHLTRAETTRKIPIVRKGTQYTARALSHQDSGVPVVIAVRDMLKIARTASEVKAMIKQKLLAINGRKVRDYREPILLYSILEAGDTYRLTLLPTGRFSFEKTKDTSRIAKVIGKKMLKNKIIQINLHDDTNVLSKENISLGDSLELGIDNKVKRVIKLEKGKKALIITGKSIGLIGTVKNIEGRSVYIELNGREVHLDKDYLMVL